MASWPPSLLPIAQGEPTSSGVGREGVVGPLAVDLADRVDRRHVDHVEAHRPDRGQPLGGRPQVAADDLPGLLVDVGALGAREELIPAGEQRPLAVGEEVVGPLGGEQVPQRVGGEDLLQCLGLGRRQSGLDRAVRVAQCLDGVVEHCLVRLDAGGRGSVRGRDPGRHPLEQQHALGEHQLDVHTGADLDACVVQPGADRVAPRLHLEGPRALDVRGHGRGHPRDLALDVVHPLRETAYAGRVGEHDLGAELVVTFPEDQRGDLEALADRRLCGVPPEVDHRCHVHDRDTSDHVHNTCEARR